MNDAERKFHREMVEELQEEWEANNAYHTGFRRRQGIRSSQISAIIAWLIKKGIIKMPEMTFDFQTELASLLNATYTEFGTSFPGDIHEVTTYAEKRTLHLSTLVGNPGYEQAVLAERDNIALKAGIVAAVASDRMDQRVLGVIQSAISVAAKAAAFA